MSEFAVGHEYFGMSFQSERWFDNINNLLPRGGASIITTLEYILIFGGANREARHFNDVWVYNKKTASKKKPKWMEMKCSGDIPPPRSGQSMCIFEGTVLLFGGIDVESEAVFNDLYTLNTDTWEWNYAGESADGEEITPRNSHSLHVITVPSSAKTHPEGTVKDAGIEHDSKEVGAEASSYLVLFGGSSPERGPMSDTYYAALPSGGITNLPEFYVTWKLLPMSSMPAPCAREMHAAALLPQGDGLVISGGRTEDNVVLSDVWVLSASGSSFASALESFNTAEDVSLPSFCPTETDSSSSSSGVDPATLISVLTTPTHTDVASTSIDISKVQPIIAAATPLSTNMHPIAWTKVHSLELPHPRCAHAAVVSGGDMILFGGFTGQGISEDLIIARNVTDVIASSQIGSASRKQGEVYPSTVLSQPASAVWSCLEMSRPIGGRLAHSMASISLALVKKTETDKSGIVIFGGSSADKEFNDMWVLSAATKV